MGDVVYNFGPGPAKLPPSVLKKAQEEMLDYNGSGMSVMELSHRSKEFEAIIQKTESDLRALMKIPHNYKVLFLQGGGNTQFSVVPLNLLGKRDAPVDYIVTGTWSQKAAAEAKRYTSHVNIINCKTEEGYVQITEQKNWKLTENAAYVYYCANETVDGVEFQFIPEIDPKIPLVCDMSSNILSREVDVSKFALIYAGAQKNIGMSGVTIVIVREDLLGKSLDITPIMLDYKINADNNSLYNTPPTYAVYICGLVMQWMLKEGGVQEIQKRNQQKSSIIYDMIDNSKGFYKSYVKPDCRSKMNVTFRIVNPQTGLKDENLEKEFLELASKRKMVQLAGHRSVGGIRASLYNAMDIEGTQALANLMREFAQSKTQ